MLESYDFETKTDKNYRNKLTITRPLCARIYDKRDIFFPDHFQGTSTIIPDQILLLDIFCSKQGNDVFSILSTTSLGHNTNCNDISSYHCGDLVTVFLLHVQGNNVIVSRQSNYRKIISVFIELDKGQSLNSKPIYILPFLIIDRTYQHRIRTFVFVFLFII